MPTDKKTIEEYNKNNNEWLKGKGLGHSHLEKPAMYKELPNLNGKSVLCIGCGAGEECEHINSLGAKKVIGIDISKELIDIAKKNYPTIDFYVMDMEKLKFKNESFDFIYSSLVMHYVKDWTKVLKEVKRVLKSNGIFLFSTHNPVYWGAERKKDKSGKSQFLGYSEKDGVYVTHGDYLNSRKINDIWFNNFKVTYYHRPISLLLKDILKSSFKIEDCIEPKPLASVKKLDLNFWIKANKIPLFIIFKLKK
ncbi:MAG: class I SAM-dependent methyltransferase [Nanoarchaeota archaeon]|nr:class I SAM-dependent methyltransferase [Nanoarchaeota archaeon]